MAQKIRFLMAKVGLDGHDVGARVIARGLLEAGMEVIYTGIRRTPEQIVRIAVDEDVDVVGISILSGAHMALIPRVKELLNEAGAQDIILVCGGVIPQEHISELHAAGVSRVFLSGTTVADIAKYVQSAVDSRNQNSDILQ